MDSKENDYFSHLPDTLLFVIVSFLPFKEAVRTSVLARRWRNIWYAAKNIEFDEKLFVKNEESDENKAMQRMSFVSFIKHWLDNCVETDLHSFRLVFSHSEHHLSQIQDCIRFCVDRDVKELDLNFSDPTWNEDDLKQIPETFLELSSYESLKKLESLKLSACNFRVFQFVTFSTLKNIYLGWIEFPGSCFKNLMSMCPSLETLNLKRCWNMENFYIDSDKLRVFVIDKCLGPEVIILNAPFLSFFQYSGPSVHLQIEYHPRMVEVILDFGLQTEYIEEGEGDMLYNLLTEISSVRVLTICSYMLQLIVTADDPITLKPALENVKHLILKTELHINEFYGITFFLKNCPNLEILTIDLCTRTIFQDYKPPFTFEEHQFLTRFQYLRYRSTMCLKMVNVKGFKGETNELIVLSYLLRFGSALKYLSISLSKEKGPNGIDMESTYRQNVQRLTQFERASPHLQIFLVTE
ncbi:F-box At3g62230-like [Olea europaea subsp. europaea]|uniref:F-box At3g62230-like n=1 Tax=Olea europaea subsp. europaea TaxID=158383 RepID=A0A8S0VG53_OLEEU|nr:F-box At3g62230-like [Olea europaea subsp. europaea]